MTIQILSTAYKKRNSTKQLSGGTTVNCNLKTPTTIDEPVFEISSAYANAKYVIWGSRYYFVEDARYTTNDIVELSCTLDSLATYKTQILATTQLVERSASRNNPHIQDDLNSPTLELFDNHTQYPLSDIGFDNSGCYILTVVGTGAQNISTVGIGASITYALSAAQVLDFSHRLCHPDILQALIDEFTNPMDSVISCKWIPVALGAIDGITSPIMLGSQTLDISGKVILRRYKRTEFDINHSALFYESDIISFKTANYLQSEPYSTAVMYLPFVGIVKFPLDTLYQYDLYTMEAVVDLMTGDIVYSFTNALETYYGNCSMDCPIGATQTNVRGAIQAVVEFVGMATGNYLGAQLPTPIAAQFEAARFVGNTLPRAVNSMIGSMQIHTQHGGALSTGLSSFLSMGFNVRIRVFSRVPTMGVAEMNTLYGRPLHRVVALSSLSGYCRCSGACLELSCEYEIRREIEYHLNNGFYIE